MRAFPKAPVSAPIAARELRRDLSPVRLNIRTMPDRVEKLGDLWADFWNQRQGLEKALEELESRQS